jgi:hypothetical protein
MLSPASSLLSLQFSVLFQRFFHWDCFRGAAFVGEGNEQFAQGINEQIMNSAQSRLLERHSFGRGLRANRWAL